MTGLKRCSHDRTPLCGSQDVKRFYTPGLEDKMPQNKINREAWTKRFPKRSLQHRNISANWHLQICRWISSFCHLAAFLLHHQSLMYKCRSMKGTWKVLLGWSPQKAKSLKTKHSHTHGSWPRLSHQWFDGVVLDHRCWMVLVHSSPCLSPCRCGSWDSEDWSVTLCLVTPKLPS